MISQKEILDYELHSSVWAKFCGYEWMQNLAAMYLARKVRRKHERYVRSKTTREILDQIKGGALVAEQK